MPRISGAPSMPSLPTSPTSRLDTPSTGIMSEIKLSVGKYTWPNTRIWFVQNSTELELDRIAGREKPH